MSSSNLLMTRPLWFRTCIALQGLYGKASVSEINMTKSDIMFVNILEPSQTELKFTLQSQHLKILGTYVGKDGSKARDLTWEGHLRKLESILNFWRLRNLKLGGKVMVVNSLIVSWLYCTLAVVDLPLWVVKKLNVIISVFLWGAPVGKIARKTLVGLYCEGGLKLVDIVSKKNAFRMKMVKKYLCDINNYGWKHIMRFF